MSEMSDATALLSHTGWIQALARNLASDPEGAEDAAQDTWVTALERQPDTDRPLRGWLATVLRSHLSKQRARDSHREYRERSVSRRERTASTFDLVAKATTQKELVEAVLELQEPYRETILLRFFESLSYRDIALRMDVTPATVNSRITRGLSRLRERLDAHYGDRQAWLTAFAPLTAPLTQAAKGAAAVGTGALTMTTITQISLFIAASTTVAVTAWQLDPATPPSEALVPVSLAGTAAEPEGIELLQPPQPVEESRVSELATLPAELENAQPFEASAEDTWEMDFHQEYTLASNVQHLTVNSGAGDVTIVRGEGSNVVIDAHVQADLERVDANGLTPNFDDHVLIEEGRGTLEIGDAHSKRKENGWGVSLTVHVPGNLALDVFGNSGAGDVTVRHASGEVGANSGAGDVTIALATQDVQAVSANSGAGDVDIEVGLVRGSLKGNSGAGDVTASLSNAAGSPQVTLNSGAGDVTLRVPGNVSGSFELKSDTGDVTVPASLGLTVENAGEVGQRARGIVGTAGPSFELKTGAGDVTVELAELSGAR